MRRQCCQAIIIYLLLILITKTLSAPRYSSRIVHISTGAIRGIILELNSRLLEPVEVFRGVPYAAPPVGDLRYRPPEPPVPWSGTKLADTFGPVCAQKYPDVTNKTAALLRMPKGRFHFLKRLVPLLVNQSEDCLFLNMYIPASGVSRVQLFSKTTAVNSTKMRRRSRASHFVRKEEYADLLQISDPRYSTTSSFLRNRGIEAPYAVLVYIHGESFEWNSGNPYDGSVLASYGHVVVVTVNYRLGVLGFLQTDPQKESNLGLLDIMAALLWVKNYIGSFGGDPNRVTIIGHDTGASLVNLLLLMSSAKGLFHRAVLLSGSVLSPWATVQQPDIARSIVAKHVGCQTYKSEEDIAPCLRTKPVSSLIDVPLEAPRFVSWIGPTPSYDPLYMMEHRDEIFIRCELLIGVTTAESYLDLNAGDIQYGFEEEQRDRVLRTYVRNNFYYHLNEIFSTIRNEYTDWEKPVPHPINIRDATMEALSDGHTVSPLLKVGYLHARRGAATYFLHFAYQAKDTDYPQRLGSVRGEDITYIFGLPLVAGQPNFPHNFSRQDMGVSETIINFLTNFAKTGNPNEPKGSNPDYGAPTERSMHKSLNWDPYETSTQKYLSLSQKPRMKSHYRGHKMAIWLNLIPQLHQAGNQDVSMRHHHFHEQGDHYYSGIVRAESFTRLPPPRQPTSSSRSPSTQCVPNVTSRNEEDSDSKEEEEDESELLQRLTTENYSSYTTALGVTVGVGCLLLVVNLLVFVGIYYQRRHSPAASTESEDIPLSQRTSVKRQDAPPCYNALVKNTSVPDPPPPPRHSAPDRKQSTAPKPPLRTSSVGSGTIKKRVQIQEFSV